MISNKKTMTESFVVAETTIAVVRMVVLFAGVIAIAARVEMFNHNK